MKTYLIISFFFLSTFAFSQENLSEVGLKAGLNINDLGGKLAGLYSTTGIHVGGYYESIISSYASIQVELVVSLQGAALTLDKEDRLNYTYLNLPILGKFYVVENFDFELGPQIGYLLVATEKDPVGNINITQQVRRFDFSLAIGVGYKYRGRTSLTLRYNLGINNTNENNVIYSKRLTNRVFQASIAYIL